MQLGRKKPEEAAKGVGNAMICALAIGVIICALCSIFLKPICHLTGVTDLILPYAMDYGRIIVAGFPMVAFTCCFASIIRADGSPKFSMAGLVFGCITNIILDYLFVFPLHMGVQGAALATLCGQLVNSIIFLFYFTRFKQVKLTKGTWKLSGKYIREIARLGISSFIVQIAVVVIIIVTNNLLIIYGAKSVYGAEIPLTALGVTMKINNILIALMVGIGAGALPIIGYNYGAGNLERVKKAIRLAVISATICGAIATVFFQIFPEQIVAIFGAESDLYVDFGVKCLRIFLMLCTLDGVNNVVPTCFQAVNKPGYSVVASVMRQIGFNVPPAIIFAALFGVTGILWGGPVCALLSFVLNLFLMRAVFKRIDQELK